MREEGVVSKIISAEQVEVAFLASQACRTCGLCRLTPKGQRVIEAVNNVKAGLGDRVEVEISSIRFLAASFLLYMVPVLAVVLGYFLGWLAGRSENAGIVGALAALAVTAVLIKKLDARLGRGVSCRIIKSCNRS